MFFSEDILLGIIVLSHDDLFCPEEGSKLLVELHFLLISSGIVADPEILGICFESDVEHSEWEDEEEGECAHDDNSSVVEVEAP